MKRNEIVGLLLLNGKKGWSKYAGALCYTKKKQSGYFNTFATNV